jgi:serine/threonine-protein kinase
VQLLWRLAGGMAAVHGAGIIHRDLKPGNVIVSEGYRPKITDFGVAASLSGQTSMLMGTTKYMAPELFGRGDVDARSDMYSLGFIFYELFLGRQVFNEIFDEVVRDPRISAVRWMKWHGNESVQAPPLHQVNPAIPKELSDIIARMTAKNRDDRYPDMEALGQAIKTDLAGVPLADEAEVAERTLPQAAILEPPPIEEIEIAPEPLPDETPTAARSRRFRRGQRSFWPV